MCTVLGVYRDSPSLPPGTRGTVSWGHVWCQTLPHIFPLIHWQRTGTDSDFSLAFRCQRWETGDAFLLAGLLCMQRRLAEAHTALQKGPLDSGLGSCARFREVDGSEWQTQNGHSGLVMALCQAAARTPLHCEPHSPRCIPSTPFHFSG